jgi:hypothetical protein
MKSATAMEIDVKIIVKPVAILKAAPGLRSKVNCRNEPRIFRGDVERVSIAQFFVKKSIAQTRHAREKRR